jgi:hypothetical protein
MLRNQKNGISEQVGLLRNHLQIKERIFRADSYLVSRFFFSHLYVESSGFMGSISTDVVHFVLVNTDDTTSC